MKQLYLALRFFLFGQLESIHNTEENKHFMKEKNVSLYRGARKEDPSTAVVIEQAEEYKSIAMFSNSEVRPLNEGSGHIYD